jgi:hypothetical protein
LMKSWRERVKFILKNNGFQIKMLEKEIGDVF